MEFSILSFEETPDTLYHYTSLEALVSIVQSKRLRASNIRFLNDESEALKLKESVVSLLRERQSPAEDEEMINEVSRQIEAEAKRSVFVASVSAKGDLLSQWRAYCPPGLGVSIGFSKNALTEQFIANQSGGPPHFVSAPFQKVRYYAAEHQSDLVLMLENLLRIEQEGKQSVKPGQLNISALAACLWPASWQQASPGAPRSLERITKLATDTIIQVEGPPGFPPAPPFATISGWVNQLAPFIKHEAFEEECEWRKVISKAHRAVPGQKFRPGRSTLIPFVEIMLDVKRVGGECVSREEYFINEVVIGPTPTPELTREALQSLFISEGRPEVVVRTSCIPYRSW